MPIENSCSLTSSSDGFLGRWSIHEAACDLDCTVAGPLRLLELPLRGRPARRFPSCSVDIFFDGQRICQWASRFCGGCIMAVAARGECGGQCTRVLHGHRAVWQLVCCIMMRSTLVSAQTSHEKCTARLLSTIGIAVGEVKPLNQWPMTIDLVGNVDQLKSCEKLSHYGWRLRHPNLLAFSWWTRGGSQTTSHDTKS